MSQVIYPRISEKAYGQASSANVYTFVVPADTNKIEVKRSVEKLYEVTVTNVNISILKGKEMRFMMKRGKSSEGKRQNTKKAYVTLKEGDSIPVFAAADEEQAAAPVAAGRVKTKKEKK